MIPLRLRLAMGAAGTVSPLVLVAVVRFAHVSIALGWGALLGAGAAWSAMAWWDAIREVRARRAARRRPRLVRYVGTVEGGLWTLRPSRDPRDAA